MPKFSLKEIINDPTIIKKNLEITKNPIKYILAALLSISYSVRLCTFVSNFIYGSSEFTPDKSWKRFFKYLDSYYLFQLSIYFLFFNQSCIKTEYGYDPKFSTSLNATTDSASILLIKYLTNDKENGSVVYAVNPPTFVPQYSKRLLTLKSEADRISKQIYTVLYRGYGNNKGTPSRKNMIKDHITGFKHLLSLKDKNGSTSNNITIVSWCAGCEAAIELAIKYGSHVKSLILISPPKELVNWRYLYFQKKIFSLFLDKKSYNFNCNKLKDVKCPVNIIYGKDNRGFSYETNAKKLYEEVKKEKAKNKNVDNDEKEEKYDDSNNDYIRLHTFEKLGHNLWSNDSVKKLINKLITESSENKESEEIIYKEKSHTKKK